MTLEFFPYPLLAGLLLLALLAALRLRAGRGLADLARFVLFGLYLLALVGVLLFPMPVNVPAESRSTLAQLLSRVNLVPLRFGGLFDMPLVYALKELGGNFLLTVPLGAGLPFFLPIPARRAPWMALAAGLSTELAQLLAVLAVGGMYRSVDINDALLNALGAGVGWLLYRAWAAIFQKQPRPGVRARPRGTLKSG